MNRSRNPYLTAWIIFTLLGTVGGNIVAIFVAHSILALFDKAGVQESVRSGRTLVLTCCEHFVSRY
jgi:hypothetical protein